MELKAGYCMKKFCKRALFSTLVILSAHSVSALANMRGDVDHDQEEVACDAGDENIADGAGDEAPDTEHSDAAPTRPQPGAVSHPTSGRHAPPSSPGSVGPHRPGGPAPSPGPVIHPGGGGSGGGGVRPQPGFGGGGGGSVHPQPGFGGGGGGSAGGSSGHHGRRPHPGRLVPDGHYGGHVNGRMPRHNPRYARHGFRPGVLCGVVGFPNWYWFNGSLLWYTGADYLDQDGNVVDTGDAQIGDDLEEGAGCECCAIL